MKTEGLTYVEALKAYVEGHRIRTASGSYEYWHDDGEPKASTDPNFIHSASISPYGAPFSIVEPKRKQLTFDEAILCERVRVEFPEGLSPYRPTHTYIKGEGYGAGIASMLDLAERRRWPMYEVKEGE